MQPDEFAIRQHSNNEVANDELLLQLFSAYQGNYTLLMKHIVHLMGSADRVSNPKQIAVVFGVLLIDAVTFQLLWPGMAWVFGSGPEAMWGIASPNQKYASDWFFHFFYWAVTIGLFSLWALPGNRQMSFYRWFALWIFIWSSQKLLGMIVLGYVVIIGIFNDGCPTYQFKSDDEYFAECAPRVPLGSPLYQPR